MYYLTRRSNQLIAHLSAARGRIFGAGYAVFGFLFVVPLLLFALLSVKKSVGLHWVLGFYPFLYLLLFFVFTEEELVKTVKFTAVFSLAHLILVGAALSVPLKYFQGNKNYSSLLMVIRPGEFGKLLDAHEGACVPATTSYAASAIFTYQFDRYFLVFGGGSHHGRQDDFQTDFRKLDGRDICIIRNTEPKPDDYAPFFQNVTTERRMIDNARVLSGQRTRVQVRELPGRRFDGDQEKVLRASRLAARFPELRRYRKVLQIDRRLFVTAVNRTLRVRHLTSEVGFPCTVLRSPAP